MDTIKFKNLLNVKARELYRSMPWRNDTRTYYILVSELMLQQTQVSRVLPKFNEFISAFPSEKELAAATLSKVLVLWQGLGYNRRAKFLHEAAKVVVHELNGKFPNTIEGLVKLPGVGKNTAGAIMAYSYNQPSIYVETNIRTVYIHHFFLNETNVDDEQIIELLNLTLDQKNPRKFYWALMDYGNWLKTNGIQNVASSAHYKKQSPLKGSIREVRGMVISILKEGATLESDLTAQLPNDNRSHIALTGLEKDGLITRKNAKVYLTK